MLKTLLIRSRYIKIFAWVVLVIFLGACFFLWGAFVVKDKIFPYKLAKTVYLKTTEVKSKDDYELDKFWAKKVKDGGYILHFRHAQREKWHDVTAFDALELHSKIDASQSSFSKATCLTPQGIEEAKLIGKIFKINGVNVQKVISSPSCRAIQTAQYSFKRVDAIDNSLLHRSAIMKDQWDEFAHELRKLFLSNVPSIGENIVFSGHVGTLKYDREKIFEEDNTGGIDDRLETGFIVIEIIDGKIYARHKFNSIKNFVHASLKLSIK
jgi:phosphohistidine phosphatase SixA